MTSPSLFKTLGAAARVGAAQAASQTVITGATAAAPPGPAASRRDRNALPCFPRVLVARPLTAAGELERDHERDLEIVVVDAEADGNRVGAARGEETGQEESRDGHWGPPAGRAPLGEEPRS
jgi:hypothetical protein